MLIVVVGKQLARTGGQLQQVVTVGPVASTGVGNLPGHVLRAGPRAQVQPVAQLGHAGERQALLARRQFAHAQCLERVAVEHFALVQVAERALDQRPAADAEGQAVRQAGRVGLDEGRHPAGLENFAGFFSKEK